ncbi:MAG: lytic transglycosylase domain-containing protein [Candidatus Nanopelagicaceae bacterium]|jgi:hypothetical protein|nr:lytic transglycosylase domain-containing protein [Candidatus Nanopelagicaceae bacterium]
MSRRRLAVGAMAFTTLFLSSVEVTYAQPAAMEAVELLVAAPDEEALKAAVSTPTEPTWPTLLEMSDRSSVKAWDMLMVSVMMEKVEKARTPKGAKSIAQGIAKEKYGWGSYQFSCLNTLWTKESNWNYRARNPRTGAHGIPQALPATKMEIIGTDWRTNPVTQITWGLHYIDVRYETPCKALSKFKRSRYY